MALNVANLQQLASRLPNSVQQPLGAALAAQDKLNQDINNAIKAQTSYSWVYPTLVNGWVAVDDNQKPRYTKLASGLVVIAGDIASGTVASPAFYLDRAYWPIFQLQSFPIWTSSNTFCRLYISGVDGATNGSVTVGAGANNAECPINVIFLGTP